MNEYVPWLVEGKTPRRDEEFWAMPWREAEKFTKWFIASMSARIEALERLIRSKPGYEGWRADLTRESLVPLGAWLIQHLARRAPTEEDLRSLPGPTVLNPSLPDFIVEDLKRRPRMVKWVYEDKAFANSVLADMGTYLGECLRAVGPRCRWARCRDKRDINQNQPLLLWPDDESVGYNAIQAGNVIGWKIVEGVKAPDEYARAFDAMKGFATFQKPAYEPVPKRSGEPVTSRCPQCGFGFARVNVVEGVYCNHCGMLEAGPA